ncbi:MAG TPA: SDR family oxidoreductase [Geminicoccaceae bacterium]|nr:SDR family oxidoreductase [Geminicoccaceae bacterium]
MRLEGRRALVTGAGSDGIGRAIARAFAREGADVAVHYHSKPQVAAALVGEITAMGRGSFAIQADLADAEVARATVREAAKKLGGLDIIVTAAAAIYRKPILEISDAEWDHMAALNVRGTFACATEAARLMRRAGSGGRIIMIGSVVQQIALRGQVAYGAGKGAIAQLARGMALELAGAGITVNVIAPGATLTDFNRDQLSDPKVRASREAAIPIGRLASPEDMCAAAVFLASPEAAYTTGVTIFVDGGAVLP